MQVAKRHLALVVSRDNDLSPGVVFFNTTVPGRWPDLASPQRSALINPAPQTMDGGTFWQHNGPETGTGTLMNKRVLRVASALNVLIYRLSRGKWLGHFPPGAPVCLLTTKGRKSGRSRTVPLLYLADGNDFIVVASQGGRPQHPGWYFNLEADPSGELTIGTRRLTVAARQVSDEEKAQLWPRLVEIYPPYRDYQRRTTRQIPVVRLSPVEF